MEIQTVYSFSGKIIGRLCKTKQYMNSMNETFHVPIELECLKRSNFKDIRWKEKKDYTVPFISTLVPVEMAIIRKVKQPTEIKEKTITFETFQ